MKYESSILKRLIDTYGVIGNPRYLSEIIKEFIVRGKELYPHLFTYQSDWLAHIDEFGLTPDYVVSYTGQQIYAPNTKEKPVKRAILKGQTLVNLATTNTQALTQGNVVENGVFTVYGLGANKYSSAYIEKLNTLKESTTYTVITFVYENTLTNEYIFTTAHAQSQFNTKFAIPGGTVGVLKVELTTKDSFDGALCSLRSYSFNSDGYIKYSIIILEGDYTNVDIPYFEGMQSVKLPVLTTSNEDGTKSNILTVNEEVELRGVGDVKDELDCLTGEVTQRIGEIVLDGSEEWESTDNGDGTLRFNYAISDFKNYGYGSDGKNLINNKLPIIPFSTNSGKYGLTSWCNVLVVFTEHTTLNDFKQWLSKNPITVQYELGTESIKTVDLSIVDQNENKVSQLSSFNGGTHFSTSSQGGSLPPTLTVDVVTDLEKTLMVCSLEGNTM